ncbi:MAG: sigma-70 family RNA polymerase sigma factor [Acidimicrobiales bacterium]
MQAKRTQVEPDHLTESWVATREELVGFVQRRVESREIAEDLVHDVLERLQRSDVEAIRNPQAWLYRAARNAIVDHYRTRREHVPFPVDFAALDDLDSQGPNTATRELARCLVPLIEQLPAKLQRAVIAVDLDGQTHAHAAQTESISVSGMKSRVQRGRSKLADLVGQCCTITMTATGEISDFASQLDCCES